VYGFLVLCMMLLIPNVRIERGILDGILRIICDSDWVGDPETRISVSGFVIYFLDLPICWRSKSLNGVML
jgi:hypothetical protein